jgi:putative tricarboxylic transport membrane protein
VDIAQGLLSGMAIVYTPFHIFLVFLGAVIGTLVGILPGLGVTATVAILMPVVLGMTPVTAMIMLVSMFCGARFGGAVTAIMMNLPGESNAIVTCLDGYQLALQGRAGPAMGLAAISSFVGGQVSVVMMMLLAPLMSKVAVDFGPPEFFSLTLMGLSLVTSLTGKSLIKGFLAATMGLVLATVGSDMFSGSLRLTMGQTELMDGVNFVTVAVGLFALGEILLNVEQGVKFSLGKVPRGLRNLLPTWQDIRQCIVTWIRSTIIGFIVGVLPGTGATIASFLSYGVAKTTSRTPERFGAGAVEGVAASESADNASTSGSLVPMLTLGIPGSAGTAMLMVVLLMFGLRPGPFLLPEHPEIFWGIVASMYLANVMLIIINIPLIPVVVQALRVPYSLMYIIIIVIGSIGVYSMDNSLFDLWVMCLFGVIGYCFKKLDYPPACLLLALILGPMVERAFRQSVILSDGSLMIFVERPVSAGFLFFAVLALFAPWLQRWILARTGAKQTAA